MKVPVTRPFFDNQEVNAVKEVLESGWVVQGPKTAEFERLFCEFTNIGYGKAVTSCTTALHLALLASGVNKGDEVMLPSFTFIATANAIEYIGAVPVFCDIDLDTYNISPDNIQNIIHKYYSTDKTSGLLKNKSTGRFLKAIVPVHLFGLAADMIKINEIAQEYNLKVVEDAACAVGAYINGKHVGSYGNMTCFSFHPRKAITTGEGGMVTTDDERAASTIESLRNHGATVSDLQRHKKAGYLLPEYNTLGYNYRITDIQGAIGVEQMKKLAAILEERRRVAARYDEKLIGSKVLTTPYVPDGYTHGYQSYVCMVSLDGIGINDVDKAHEWRNALMDKMETAGVATRQGTHAVHTLGYYKEKYSLNNSDYFNSYLADRLTITLPLYAGMTEEEQDYVINTLMTNI